MKRLLLSAALLLITSTTAMAESCIVNDTSGTPLNVRNAPNSNAPILGALSNGTNVTTSTTSGDWVYVVPKNGKTGWVAKKYLDCPDPSARRAKLPSEMLGAWCPSKVTLNRANQAYERRNCPNDDGRIVIGPDGYEGIDASCKTISTRTATIRKSTVYTVMYRCLGEGTWTERKDMFIGEDGNLEGMLVVRSFE
jgi:hypothetical protein